MTASKKDRSIHCGANRCTNHATYNILGGAGNWTTLACERHLGILTVRRLVDPATEHVMVRHRPSGN
ncbi:hypothetical protein ACQFYA_21130 [Promicromonospora sp. Marseille-Q5078]